MLAYVLKKNFKKEKIFFNPPAIKKKRKYLNISVNKVIFKILDAWYKRYAMVWVL